MSNLVEKPLSVVKIGAQTFEKNSAIHKHSVTSMDSWPSQSGLGAIWGSNAAVISVLLQSPTVSFLKSLILEVDILNSHATDAATLVNPYFLFNQIQLYISSQQVTTIFPENLFEQLGEYSLEKATLLGAATNWAALRQTNNTFTVAGTTAAGANPVAVTGTATGNTSGTPYWVTSATITAGATQKLYIPLDTLLNQVGFGNLPITHMNAPIQLRFLCNSNVLQSDSTLTDNNSLSCTNFQIYGIGEKLSPENYNAVSAMIQEAGQLTFYGYAPDRYIQTFSGISSSSTIQANLSSLDGTYNTLDFFLRVAGSKAEMQYQYDLSSGGVTANTGPSAMALENVSLLNASGIPVWQSGLDDKILRLAAPSCYSNSIFWDQFRFYRFNFCDDPADSQENGTNCGNIYINNSWRLSCQPTSIPSGTVTVELVCLGRRKMALTLDSRGKCVARMF